MTSSAATILPRRAARAARVVVALALVSGCGRGGSGAQPAFDPDSIPDAYARPTAALMWPGATRAFQITPSGDLANGVWTVRIRPAADGVAAPGPRRIAFEERWLPIAHWVRRSGPVAWSFEAVPFPPEAPGATEWTQATRDSGLLVSLEVAATNHGARPSEADLDVSFAPPDSDIAFGPFDAAAEAGIAGFGDREKHGLACGWTTRAVAPTDARVHWTLAPGATRTERFLVSAYPAAAAALARAFGEPHRRRAADARRFWRAEVDSSTRFELGDAEVERALAAALVVLLSCRERRGEGWVPIGGPLQYRDVWLRDGARAIEALSVMGRTALARALAAGLAAYQWPSGAFLSQRGQLDGTGEALWAFDRAFLRPRPDPEVGAYAERALRAVGWCERERAAAAAAGSPFPGMLPFGDPRDNELVRAQLVGNDAWAIAGYRSAARLLRAAGRAADAESTEVGRARYARAFAAALERSRSADLPPSWQGVGRDWGNLSAAWPCGALPASDRRSEALAARIWGASPEPGLCSYGVPDSLHYYLGSDLGTWALLAGRRDDYERVLAGLLHWRTASGAAGEIFSLASRDFGRNLPPHATGAAALVVLVRNALVFDDRDSLELTLGAREAWWRHGARVRGAPTRWGTVDLAFAERDGRAEWTFTAVPVWTRLTLPPRTRLASAPKPPLVGAGSSVLAPPGTRAVVVDLAPTREEPR